jgi:hypothetical protein
MQKKDDAAIGNIGLDPCSNAFSIPVPVSADPIAGALIDREARLVALLFPTVIDAPSSSADLRQASSRTTFSPLTIFPSRRCCRPRENGWT